MVVRIVPNYPSNPNGVYYYLHCKFSLLKFKVWRGNPSSAWDNLDDTDENYINCWHNFVRSDEGKRLVPNYFQELENIEANCIYEASSDSEQTHSEEREEWMFLTDFLSNTQDQDDCNENDIDLEYWREQCSQFDSIMVSEMPTWINSQKSSYCTPVTHLQDDDANIDSLNAEQIRAFSIIRSHYVNSDRSQLLLLVTGKAGSGKSFLIDRIRHLLHDKCIISALFRLATFNVSGKT